jgi:hypothetical protein
MTCYIMLCFVCIENLKFWGVLGLVIYVISVIFLEPGLSIYVCFELLVVILFYYAVFCIKNLKSE